MDRVDSSVHADRSGGSDRFVDTGSAGALATVLFRGPGALDRAAPLLDDLHRATGVPITARMPWLRVWAEQTPRFRPLVIGIGTAARLEGAAVLAMRSYGPAVSVCDVGRGPSDYQVFPLRDPARAGELAAAVADALARLRRPWLLRVDQLPCDDVVRAIAAALPVADLVPGVGSPTTELPPGSTLSGILTTSGKKALRTGAARLRREGVELQVEAASGSHDVARALELVAEVKRRRDLAARGRSTLEDPRDAALWRGTVLAHAALGQAEVVMGRIREEVAAYAIIFTDGRSQRIWDLRYNPDLARLSPGWMLCKWLLERAIADDGVDELDWMNGEEPYKLWMATKVVPHTELRAWSSKGARRAEELFHRFGSGGADPESDEAPSTAAAPSTATARATEPPTEPPAAECDASVVQLREPAS